MSQSHDIWSDQKTIEASFTDSEWQEYHRADVKAGTAVVALMLTIFGIGVVLYSIVVATL